MLLLKYNKYNPGAYVVQCYYSIRTVEAQFEYPIPGILTRYGFWFGLDDRRWRPRALPPLTYLSAGSPPNAMQVKS